MFKTLNSVALALLIVNAVHAAGPACDVAPQDTPLPHRYSYVVAGTGRLHLHKAPDKRCADKRLFVIPRDSLVAYSDYGPEGEWTLVRYRAKSGKDYSGWVLTKRLRFTGATGPDISPAAQAYYKKAAAAAKAGKLGAP